MQFWGEHELGSCSFTSLPYTMLVVSKYRYRSKFIQCTPNANRYTDQIQILPMSTDTDRIQILNFTSATDTDQIQIPPKVVYPDTDNR